MPVDTLPDPAASLGGLLRDLRSRLRPEPGARGARRTPGLRREEVAARAGVSVTWYTWLEQGRGGPPSADVLERLADALELDAAGREVLFLLGQQRPPPLKATASGLVTPALQRVLDALPASPAYVKTPAWDIVAWNDAATAVLTDFHLLPVRERNLLRRLFLDPAVRAALPEWEADARFALAAFRVDAARAGDYPEAAEVVAELRENSAEFRRLWAENAMRSHGVARKRLLHPTAGPLELEYSAFSVDTGNGLSMVVYTPATPADAEAIARLLPARST